MGRLGWMAALVLVVAGGIGLYVGLLNDGDGAPILTVGSTEPLTTTTSLTTTTVAQAPPVLVGAGDIADCSSSGDEATAALLKEAIGAHPDVTVFAAGDLAYPDGRASDFTDCYGPESPEHHWGDQEIRSRTRPVPGNHEYHTAQVMPYFEYFGAAAGEEGKGWYSYQVGSWHVVALNSNCGAVGCGPGSEQHDWLLGDLAATEARCLAAYWHHPRFTSGTTHGPAAVTQSFWDALVSAGAEIVMVGHQHNYERFAPQDGAGNAHPQGIRQFVVGTGGKSLYEFGSPAAHSEVRIGSLGVLELTLGDDSYTWRFIDTSGSVLDEGSHPCHWPLIC